MEDKEMNILEINGAEFLVIDEDDEVITAAQMDDPTQMIFVKKMPEDKYIELNEIESLPYRQKFIESFGKYNNKGED